MHLEWQYDNLWTAMMMKSLWGQLGRGQYGKTDRKEKKLLICSFSKYFSGILLLKLWTIHFKSHASISKQPKSCLLITRRVKILSRIKQLQQDWKKQEAPRSHQVPGRSKLRCAILLAEGDKASSLPTRVMLTLLLALKKQDGKNMHFHISRAVIVGDQKMRQIWSCHFKRAAF